MLSFTLEHSSLEKKTPLTNCISDKPETCFWCSTHLSLNDINSCYQLILHRTTDCYVALSGKRIFFEFKMVDSSVVAPSLTKLNIRNLLDQIIYQHLILLYLAASFFTSKVFLHEISSFCIIRLTITATSK